MIIDIGLLGVSGNTSAKVATAGQATLVPAQFIMQQAPTASSGQVTTQGRVQFSLSSCSFVLIMRVILTLVQPLLIVAVFLTLNHKTQ